MLLSFGIPLRFGILNEDFPINLSSGLSVLGSQTSPHVMQGSVPCELSTDFNITSRVLIYALMIVTALHNCLSSGSLNSQN